MKWFQVKEQAAGKKRLMLTWWSYRLFGKRFVQLIALVVSLSAFIFSKQIRQYTRKNLRVLFEATKDSQTKPTLFNMYRLTFNYALSLVDKMEAVAQRYDAQKIIFETDDKKQQLINDIKSGSGVFFISMHTGNIEILRSLIENPQNTVNPRVNIFLSEEQCKVFNDFLKKIQIKTNTATFAIENITPDTGIILKERLENGDIAFMAGDRTSYTNQSSTFSCNIFNKTVEFPKGTFKFAYLMETKIYFICVAKIENDRYYVHLENFKKNEHSRKSEEIARMQSEYVEFWKSMALKYPLQFYHFYDLFSKY